MSVDRVTDSRNAVVLFTGNAASETRQKRLPPRLLRRLHGHLRETIQSLRGVDLLTGWNDGREFHLDGPFKSDSASVESLAEKVSYSLRRAFAQGYRRVLLLAGDIAELTRADLVSAFDSLDSEQSAVIGRSGDGGFYLAAFRSNPRIDWKAIHWHRDACDSLTALLCEAGFNVHAAREIDDIDSVSDIARILNRLRIRARALWLSLISAIAPDPLLFMPALIEPHQSGRSPISLRAPPRF